MKISRSLLQQIHTHLEAGYPNEACGVLLGRDGSVSEIVPATNTRTDSAHNRYLIEPLAYRDVERDADKRGLQVLGIFHSHPDVPARPSQFDLDNALPYLSYLIVSVASGKAVDALCWRLNEMPREFVPEPIEII
jgi:proteasome lid subunit RPN8/RPN11